jgi:hypothetical protein
VTRCGSVRIDVSEKLIATVIRLKIISIVLQSLVTANVVPVLLILLALIMELIRSSETSVLIIATRRNTREDGILHSHRCGNLKPYELIKTYYTYTAKVEHRARTDQSTNSILQNSIR